MREPESVAEHSWRVAIIAYVLAALEGADPARLAVAALPGKADLQALAAGWHPYATVATWYLWRSLSNTPALEVAGG